MKRSLAIVITIIATLTFVGCSGSGGSGSGYLSNYSQDYNQPANVQQTQPQTEAAQTVNAEYLELFNSRYIVDMDTLFYLLDSASFATVDSDGIVEKLQFGYKDDIVKEMVDTLYCPVAGMTDNEKQTLEQEMKSYFSQLDAQSFCTSTYDMGDTWFVIKFHLTDLDNVQTHSILVDYGILNGVTNSLVSMKETESLLLSSGYIKK